MLLIFILIASLLASTEATTPMEECVEQPIYGDNCTVFTDEDCTELNKRYPVACECFQYCHDFQSITYNENMTAQATVTPTFGAVTWTRGMKQASYQHVSTSVIHQVSYLILPLRYA